ncbi:hypothetical protein SUGI_0445550 [Cryptomeria japonica]|nr:hypothetical protein SUGI_0445550 [Cryptomeria japonica]
MAFQQTTNAKIFLRINLVSVAYDGPELAVKKVSSPTRFVESVHEHKDIQIDYFEHTHHTIAILEYYAITTLSFSDIPWIALVVLSMSAGRTVLVMRPGFQNATSWQGPIKYLVYCMENAVINLPKEQEQMVWLIDSKDIPAAWLWCELHSCLEAMLNKNTPANRVAVINLKLQVIQSLHPEKQRSSSNYQEIHWRQC